jgi:hypothetical protein
MPTFATPIVASGFSALVRRRSWDWLAALQRRLNVDRLQILDERGLPLMPDSAPSLTTILSDPEVVSAVARATQSQSSESLRLGQMHVACVGLVSGPSHGAMLLARKVTQATASNARTELDVIGMWLRAAVEAHLGSTERDHGGNAPHGSSLFKALNAAAGDGNESTLMQLFANALAIWHDLDLRAYVQDAEGLFRLEVVLPGAHTRDIPGILNGSDMSIGADLARVSGHDREFLGFCAGDEVVAARVGSATDGTAWLVVLSGDIEAAGERGLALYTDVLRQTLQNVASASLLGIERAVWRHLVGDADHMAAAAEAALNELRTAVGGTRAALSMSFPRNRRFVRVGDVQMLDDVRPSRADRLATTARVDDGGTLMLIVEGPAGQFFTSRDQRIVETSGQLFASWAGGVLRRAPTAFERRAVSGPFEEILEQAAWQSAAHGATVSVCVIQVGHAEQPPDVVQRLAVQIRANLRAGEPVGVLGGREIGLLLHDCTADVARRVIGRLRGAIAGREEGSALANGALGISEGIPGSAPRQLVRAARADATLS